MIKIFFIYLLALGFNAKIYAGAAEDDYKAGLNLYSTQNYSQAIAFFDAALKLEPNNAAALLGRANCYYSQGKYPDALADYQKVQALQPQNSQVASFIQILQAKIGNSPGVPPLPATASGDHRMEKRFGLVIGLISDPFISDIGISADYNLNHYLRLTGSLGFLYSPGSAQATYVNGTETSSNGLTITGTSFGLGVKALVPGWEFSPVIGLNLADTSLNLPPGFEIYNISNGTTSNTYNLFWIYTNIGFDYQAKDGFDLGFGFDMSLNNIVPIPIPGLNIGKFF